VDPYREVDKGTSISMNPIMARGKERKRTIITMIISLGPLRILQRHQRD
jgi:hypothetical protein